MVYNDLKIVWQAAKRVRKGLQSERNLEFLEFLALEGGSQHVRKLAMLQFLDLSAVAAPVKSGASRCD